MYVIWTIFIGAKVKIKATVTRINIPVTAVLAFLQQDFHDLSNFEVVTPHPKQLMSLMTMASTPPALTSSIIAKNPGRSKRVPKHRYL